MRSLRSLGVAMLCGAVGMACSRDEEAKASPRPDRVIVDATEATRDAIGVASWGITPGPGSGVINGYDADDQPVLSFDYRVENGEVSTFEASIDAGTNHRKLRVEARDATNVRVIEDSFGSPAVKQILARIVADLGSQTARAARPLQAGAVTDDLHPRDGQLPQTPTLVTGECPALVNTAASNAATTASACTGGATDPACGQGIQTTNQSQTSGQQCSGICTGEAKAIAESEVSIQKGTAEDGEPAARGYIEQALDALCIGDKAARERWMSGYVTLTRRESSFNPNAVNTSDSNATGATAADGHPRNCSRGLAQCIPSTFAAYHQPGTSENVYDPVANIAASMNYAIGRYKVSRDGSDLAAKIQQADPGRGPGGY